MGRSPLFLALGLLALALTASIASAQPYISSWSAAEGIRPNEDCPVWQTSGDFTVLGGGKLTITTTSAGQQQTYSQSGSALAPPTLWTIEVLCHRVSGSTSSTVQAPMKILFQRSKAQGNTLYIGDGEIFLLSSPTTRGATRTVFTQNGMHNYHIDVDGSAVTVSYDGAPVLTGSLFADPGTGDGAWLYWGQGGGTTFGVSEWAYVTHNGSAVNCATPTQPPTWGSVKTLYR